MHEAGVKLQRSQAGQKRQGEKIAEVEGRLVGLGVSEKQLHDLKVRCKRRENAGDVRLKFTEGEEEK